MTFPVVGSNIPGSYEISNSLRFNDNDSARLTKTFGSAGTRTTWTFSTWVKRSLVNDGTNQRLFASGSGTSVLFSSIEYASDKIRILEGTESGSATTVVRGAGLNRDVSAWQHVFIKYDSTEGTASNRIKIYLNGVEVSYDSTTYPALNYNSEFGNNVVHTIGATSVGASVASFFDGYMAETHFIDGTAKAHTDFGEFDEDSGVWKPKQYAGTYGTNGFYLKFNNTGNIGEDSSGNDNTFTPTNLSGTTDVTTDTPTNNFATMSSIDTNGQASLSEGNTQLQRGSNYAGCNGTFGLSSGKWYWEVKTPTPTVSGENESFGVSKVPHATIGNNYLGLNTNSWAIMIDNAASDIYKNHNNSFTDTGINASANDIFNIALDMDNNKVYFGRNGTYFDSGDPAAGTNPTYSSVSGDTHIYPAFSMNGNDTLQVNFGNAPFSISSGNSDENGYGNFEYAPPSGYLALCTQNLATTLSPTIDDASQYFETTTYTGNASTLAITSLNFQPDFLWIKRRSSASTHALFNSNVGRDKSLGSESTDAEYTSPSDKDLISFDSNGFTVAQPSQRNVNGSGQTFVGWSWKANGGTTSSNTDGSITSTVQANTTAGFSIVTYTGNGTNGSSIGHGLGQAPAFIIVKRRDGTSQWVVENVNSLGMYLNLTDGATTSANVMNFSSSSIITFDTSNDTNRRVNFNGETYVAYCFAGIEGYSKFGSYTGNGSADGTFVYTGFRPSFLIIKRTDLAKNWYMFDTVRNTYNVIDDLLAPNLSDAETSGTGTYLDTLSNGFKLRQDFSHTNASGSTQIYMAFAENPFVTSGATPVTAR